MPAERLQRLQQKINAPVLVKKKENLFYLTGHSFDYRSQEYLLVKKTSVVGFGSGLEKIGWTKEADRMKNIGAYLPQRGRLDIEYEFTYGEGEYLKYRLPKVKIKPTASLVDLARQIKEPSELQSIRKSMRVVERVFGRVKQQIAKKLWTEEQLAYFITQAGYKAGAHDISFPAIVASGANSAIPHHVPGAKRLKPGETIILDFGFKVDGYCSDFTRTLFLKHAPDKLASAYNQVELAYRQALSAAGVGTKARVLYDLAYAMLERKSLGKYFIHNLGHGTGLEIHELPNLSPLSKEVLRLGMVFSIEPGVYFPKVGGVRIEDLVYLKTRSAQRFINVSTALKDNIIS